MQFCCGPSPFFVRAAAAPAAAAYVVNSLPADFVTLPRVHQSRVAGVATRSPPGHVPNITAWAVFSQLQLQEHTCRVSKQQCRPACLPHLRAYTCLHSRTRWPPLMNFGILPRCGPVVVCTTSV